MERKEVPQDESKLVNFTKEVCYAVDDNGKYVSELSTGWDVKTDALKVAWEDINNRVEEAKQRMQKGEVSPVLFFMELKLMDLPTLADYTGFWKWTIKRHFKPSVFSKLSDRRIRKYAEVFEVSPEELRQMNKI
jgi:hypothetical protein